MFIIKYNFNIIFQIHHLLGISEHWGCSDGIWHEWFHQWVPPESTPFHMSRTAWPQTSSGLHPVQSKFHKSHTLRNTELYWLIHWILLFLKWFLILLRVRIIMITQYSKIYGKIIIWESKNQYGYSSKHSPVSFGHLCFQ